VLFSTLAAAIAASGCQTTTGGDVRPQRTTGTPGGAFILDNNAKGPAPEIPGAKKGGTLTVLGSTDLERHDPQADYAGDGIVLYNQLITRTLTTYYEDVAADGTIKTRLVGDLAMNTGETADCKTWKYTLRDGVKFEDGSAITSKDIAYGISRSFDDSTADGPHYLQIWLAGKEDYQSVYKGPYAAPGTIAPGITTPDDKTIQFQFASAHCDFPAAAAFLTTVPVPQSKDPGPNRYDSDAIVASGPYMIETLIPGEKFSLVRNPNWDPATDPARHAYPDKIVVDWTATDTVVAAKRFVADVGEDKNALAWDRVPTEALAEVLNGPAASRSVEGDTVFSFYVNINTQRVTDVDVRRALIYSYNQDAILKIIGGDKAGKPSTTIMAPTVPGYEKYDAYPKPITGDVDKAKALLQGKTVTPLKFCYRPGTPIRELTAVAAKQAWQRAGFQIVMAPTDATNHFIIVGTKGTDCDLITGGWGQDYPSGSTVLGVIMKGGAAITPTGNGNLSYFDNAEVNAELDRIAALNDAGEAGRAYAALDKKIMTDYAPLIPSFYSRWFSMVGSRVGGAYISGLWGIPSLQNIWIK